VAFGADAAKTTQEKFDALKEAGVFSGYPGTTDAKLGQDMTRAEFAKVLVKLFGLKEIHGQYSYKDKNYDAKNWAAPFIEAVTAEGLMQAKDLTKKIFDFNGKITVEEASKTLVTALKLEPVKDAQNKATDWAKGYFEAAVNAGLFSKDANPKANATRAQLVEAAFAADEMSKGSGSHHHHHH
uniref:Surface (S-) layer glycoprotein n=1 Tax=Paenibacillus alvei TaxID=44250 RepID=UPI000E20C8F0|nr:Chain A, Surface (S-) layer glycoprotein [Paenibacillus alvei]6CWN_A Chain A, Surface (S-) layer glycoprotein [Paenibacillus alvei]7SV5_A Chain A, Surface (S-) layer glycoprotein [Paenibacillus alvei]7SV5_B Chain B, Surface (S-) layer glycoprotein [Paenibacillus alvei]